LNFKWLDIKVQQCRHAGENLVPLKVSAILRASGANFDVDSFAKDSPLAIDRVYRVGDPLRPIVDPHGRKRKRSGFSVVVSEVDFDDFRQQLEDALSFLGDNADELMRLTAFPGVQSLCIDFGANIYPPGWCSFSFPHQLLHLAGQVKVDLVLSVYPTSSEEDLPGELTRADLDAAYEEFVAQKARAKDQAGGGHPAPPDGSQ